jgi:hypothetical protein
MFPCILLFNFSIPPYKQQPNISPLFWTKAMLRSTEELSLTAIVRMKKSKLKYRLTTCKNNKETKHTYECMHNGH